MIITTMYKIKFTNSTFMRKKKPQKIGIENFRSSVRTALFKNKTKTTIANITVNGEQLSGFALRLNKVRIFQDSHSIWCWNL